MDLIDRKIKKYTDVLTTLKENKRHRAKDDNYNYDVDIMNTKWFIEDLEAIKKDSASQKQPTKEGLAIDDISGSNLCPRPDITCGHCDLWPC